MALGMPVDRDFESFLAIQNSGSGKLGNLSERKAVWLARIGDLYAQVQLLLEPYFRSGAMASSVSEMTITEDILCSYLVPSLTIDLGRSSVRFVPVGTILFGAPGRVDLVGLRGQVRFVLAHPDLDRPMLGCSRVNEDRSVVIEDISQRLKEFAWKISTQPPSIRYTPLSVSSLQSAIMEAASGRPSGC